MQISMPSGAQLTAVGRHVISYAAGAVTVLAMTNVINSDQAASLNQSVSQISQGVALIASGLGPIIAIASSVWAAMSHSQASAIAAVNSADNGVKVVSSGEAAPQVNGPLK